MSLFTFLNDEDDKSFPVLSHKKIIADVFKRAAITILDEKSKIDNNLDK